MGDAFLPAIFFCSAPRQVPLCRYNVAVMTVRTDLRLPDWLHTELRSEAHASGRSLNAVIVDRLSHGSASEPVVPVTPTAEPAVESEPAVDSEAPTRSWQERLSSSAPECVTPKGSWCKLHGKVH